MAYTVTQKCISCHRCQTTCPTGAIQTINGAQFIDPNLCNNCIGYYGTPQCAAACPTNQGCVPSFSDYWDAWFNRYEYLIKRLKNQKNQQYWDSWFNLYSEKIQQLQTLTMNS